MACPRIEDELKVFIAAPEIELNIVQTVFAELGHESVICGNFPSIHEHIEQIEYPLILLDWRLGRFFIVVACNSIRTNACNSFSVVMLLVPPETPAEQIRPAMEAGADDFCFTSSERPELELRLQSALKRAERRMLRKKEEVQTAAVMKAFESMGMGVTIVNQKGVIVYANPAEARMHGYREGELVGKEAKIFSLPEYTKPVSIDELKRLKSWKRESLNIRKDGSVFPVQLFSDVITDATGTPLGMVTISEDITASQQKEQEWKKLQHDALHDPLTGLPNRALFLDRLKGAFTRGIRREDYRLAVLYLDLDWFKSVNDLYGHNKGDEVLVSIGERLKTCLRPVDTVARFGGDEFTVLLDDLEDPSHAISIVERIQIRLAEPFLMNFQELVVSASIGIAFGPQRFERTEDLLIHADMAMYHAKKLGKNRYQIAGQLLSQIQGSAE